jgi:hypothetical protein
VGSAPVTTRVRAGIRTQRALTKELTDYPPTPSSHRQRESNTQPSSEKWLVPYQLSQHVLALINTKFEINSK